MAASAGGSVSTKLKAYSDFTWSGVVVMGTDYLLQYWQFSEKWFNLQEFHF